jgi:hypothetical protein
MERLKFNTKHEARAEWRNFDRYNCEAKSSIRSKFSIFRLKRIYYFDVELKNRVDEAILLLIKRLVLISENI